MIETMKEPCWLRAWHDDMEVIPHYATEAEARESILTERHQIEEEMAGDWSDEDLRKRLQELSNEAPTQEEKPCRVIKCDHCGDIFENEYGGTLHVLDENDSEINDWIDTADWSTDQNGHHHCGNCPILMDVEDCEHEEEEHEPYCTVCVNGGKFVGSREPGPLDDPLPIE